MNDKEYGDFIFNILKTLKKHGFPEKRVALPLEKMYESAHKKGLNFNKILEFLKEKDIDHEKTTEKVIFFDKNTNNGSSTDKQQENQNFFEGMNLDFLKNLNLSELMSKAPDILKNLDPQQLSKMMEIYSQMSESERQDILKKAKDMGLL